MSPHFQIQFQDKNYNIGIWNPNILTWSLTLWYILSFDLSEYVDEKKIYFLMWHNTILLDKFAIF